MKTLIIKNTLYTLSKKLLFFCISMAFTAFVSCSNDDAAPDMSADEKESVSLESQDDYYYDDAEGIAMAAFVNEEEAGIGGKMSTDARLTGAIVLRVGTFSSGSLKIDFGTGCTDLNGNVRKGLIIIDHIGRWNEEGGQWTITLSGYSMNGVTIEGTRKVMVVSVTESTITHDVKITDGKITWPDGSVATRACHFIREWERNATQLLHRLIVFGEAQGTLRSGRGYTIEIKDELIYDRSCAESGVFIAVQGTKLIQHGSQSLTIDYGNGTCDNMVTLTNKAGISVQYEVSK